MALADRSSRHVVDTARLLYQALRRRQARDVRGRPGRRCSTSTTGTYPFVTSSNPVAG
jgi:adenylosuccinate synthase